MDLTWHLPLSGGHYVHTGSTNKQRKRAHAFSPGSELLPVLQKALLRTAAYGLAFCSPAYPPDTMHSTALKLRLLNALRSDQVTEGHPVYQNSGRTVTDTLFTLHPSKCGC